MLTSSKMILERIDHCSTIMGKLWENYYSLGVDSVDITVLETTLELCAGQIKHLENMLDGYRK